MPQSSVEGGSFLTTSRINRLLRPLQRRCTNLAAHAHSNTVAESRTNSGSELSSVWDVNNPPPLAISCAIATGRKLRPNRNSELELGKTRRIHAVCDAFRNVVYASFGTPCTERIPSLAGLCSSVIGNYIAIDKDDVSGGHSNELTHEDDVIKLADEMYESLPSHYRGFAVVSHALSMILHTCSRCHTLVNMLLDICLSFGLIYDALRLLDTALLQAFTIESPHCLPPITHPAHATYLVDLHTRWTRESKKRGSPCGSSLFTTAAFLRAVLSTLSCSGQSSNYALWTSRPIKNLVRTIGHQDVDSLVLLIHGLTTILFPTGSKRPQSCTNRNLGMEVTRSLELRSQFLEWMEYLWDTLVVLWETPGSLSNKTWLLLVEILANCGVTDFQIGVVATDHPCTRLPDVVASLATSTLVHNQTFKNQLVPVLDRICPMPTTYAKLIAYLGQFPRQTTAEFEFFCKRLMSRLETYSSALRSQNFLELEASLWACALSHFEKVSSEGTYDLVAKYRRQLMDAVDAAERRCFGRDHPESSPSICLSSRFKRRNQFHQRRSSGHWEWEEMVGCWIRKTPLHKKRRLSGNDQPIADPLFSGSSVRHSTKGPKAVRFGPPISRIVPQCPSNSLSCEYSDSDMDKNRSDSGSEYLEDKENYPAKPRLRCPPPSKKSRTNFLTLLADAQTNRVVLHAKDGPISIGPPSAPQRRPSPDTQLCQLSGMRSKVAEQPILLPSDDSLDLFAYRTSSPTR